MSASLCPIPKLQFFDNNGVPLAGGLVYTYAPGTTTPKATYTDSTGVTTNTNPVVLDSAGRASIWLSGYYKMSVYTSLGVLIYTVDNVSSSAATSATTNQWNDAGLVLVYVNATQFTTLGDQSTIFVPGTRIRATVTAGIIYGTVVSSVVGGVPIITTVTCIWDSGTLDAGLSTVAVGIITAETNSFPVRPVITKTGSYVLAIADLNRTHTMNSGTPQSYTLPAANTVAPGSWYKIINAGAGLLTITGTVSGIVNPTLSQYGEMIVQSNGTSWYGQGLATLPVYTEAQNFYNLTFTATVGSKALTVALKTKAGNNPSAADPVVITFRNSTLTNGTYDSILSTAATSIVLSSGSTLGFVTNEAGRLYIWAINNAGTIELALSRTADIFQESNLVTTVAEGGAGGADSATTMYSASVRTNVACTCIGYVDITTGVTAGEWDNAPTKLQIMGVGVKRTGEIIQIMSTCLTTSADLGNPGAGTFTDVTGLSVVITPTSLPNKMLIAAVAQVGDSNNDKVFGRLMRGATPIGVNTDGAPGNRTQCGGQVVTIPGNSYPLPLSYLDKPASVAAQTYKMQIAPSASSNVFINRSSTDSNSADFSRTASTITVTEIQA